LDPILTSGWRPEGPGASAAVKADLIDPGLTTVQRTPLLKAGLFNAMFERSGADGAVKDVFPLS